METRLPFHMEISTRIEQDDSIIWSPWRPVNHGKKYDGTEHGYIYMTMDELNDWKKWAEYHEKAWGYRLRFTTNNERLKEVQYMEDFFNL